jgi:hypothetical protein
VGICFRILPTKSSAGGGGGGDDGGMGTLQNETGTDADNIDTTAMRRQSTISHYEPVPMNTFQRKLFMVCAPANHLGPIIECRFSIVCHVVDALNDGNSL